MTPRKRRETWFTMQFTEILLVLVRYILYVVCLRVRGSASKHATHMLILELGHYRIRISDLSSSATILTWTFRGSLHGLVRGILCLPPEADASDLP